MPNTYQMDEDIGEMFLNFPMLVSFQQFCGVNLTKFDELKKFSLDDWFR